MEIEAAAFLIREESFDTKVFFIPLTRLGNQFHVGNQTDGFLIAFAPPDDSMNGPIVVLGEENIGQANTATWSDVHISKCEFIPSFVKLRSCCDPA